MAKDAARYAAKRYTHLAQTSSLVCREVVDDRFSKQTDQQMLFIVADVTKRLLFPTAGQQTHEYRGIDIVLNISAPRNPQEFARVMAHGGLLIIVIPMPDHLAQLRSEFGLLNIEEAKREKIVVQLERDFQLAKSRVIRSTVELKTVDLHNLIHMTPNHWHLSNKIQSQIESKPQFTTTFNFEMLQFRKI
ncbi:hypothetical protein KFU94_37545 [Chloroflexi bacterium TSY]|nr:hypothetical protein [Chloroflexi bacterium TSY]